ncbi:hypothetical protein [Paenibacillus protaetiae]|uniref:Uncharacterized protein n=1 Tax=Paenibacillus protaetiae TaxID=2509456 RepID=A0A4P6ES29_9BACL|nr:hypothetical protein [Paenibacillus protaetiae]QAY65235.1 hypothetical protein ET464_01395 [Paenibacillus protaetiae]
MSILRIDGTSPECAAQAIRHLEDIGNIRGFSLFAGDVPQPYANVPGLYIGDDGKPRDKRSDYRLILLSADLERQVWIELADWSTNEAAPDYAAEIVQLLGVRANFGRLNSITDAAASPAHHFNFIARFAPEGEESSDLNSGKVMKVTMRFTNPAHKQHAKEQLHLLGQLQPLREFGGEEAEIYYFRSSFDTKQELSRCATNNVLTLHPRYSLPDVETIHKLVLQIAEQHDAEVTARIYEKLPQG